MRIWKGWTALDKAAAYENLLLTEIFPAIAACNVTGYRGISLVKRVLGDEVEFVTMMWFDNLDAVRAFAGENYKAAVVPQSARTLLSRFDAASAHYEMVMKPPML